MCRNLEYSERLREKEKVGGMPAKLNEKKRNRLLERSLSSRRKKGRGRGRGGRKGKGKGAPALRAYVFA